MNELVDRFEKSSLLLRRDGPEAAAALAVRATHEASVHGGHPENLEEKVAGKDPGVPALVMAIDRLVGQSDAGSVYDNPDYELVTL